MTPTGKPKRESPVTSYIDQDLKKRATALARKYRRLSVSRIIEESLERYLPEIERRLSRGKELA